jgi:1,4-dihydroxy-2-naphthoate octaprenyltransferase
MQKLSAWINAFRLRTLPLALSCIAFSAFVALNNGHLNFKALGLAVITTVLLQILSNLANDLGDTLNGADNENRIGPERAVQSGKISVREMKNAVIIFSLLSFASGLMLIFEGTRGISTFVILFYIFLGLGAIFAAVKYTYGKNPYGYQGLGDFSVFLFFGLVGVLGSYFLFTQKINWSLILPASSLGLLSTGVLNLNNMRDHKSDAETGKITLVVKMGFEKAKNYQSYLVLSALILSIIYVVLNFNSWLQFSYLFLITPLIARHLITVFKTKNEANLDPELKNLALTTLFFSVTFGISIWLF